MKNLKFLFATLCAFMCIGFSHAQSTNYVTTDFKALTNEGCSPFVVLLFDSSRSDNTIISRHWVVTNSAGDTVYQDNTNKTTIGLNLQDAGCYTVSLFAINRFQISDYKTKADYVCVKPRPQISFAASTMGGCPPLNVSFQCNSLAMCGIIDSITVDFKNGIVQSFPACGTFSTTYNNSGNYRPTFYVKNSCGCYADSTWTLPIVVSQKPIASFTATNNTVSCSAPYSVDFSAQSQNSNVKFKWFVNGVQQQNGTNQIFNHSFSYGSHDVKLVVTDTVTGCTDTLNRLKYVVVGQPATPAFTADNKVGCTPLKVTLTNQTPGNATNLKWIVTDDQNNVVLQRSGSPALFDSIGYTFSNVGKYNVCLIATFHGGCMDTFCAPNYISVGSLPNSDFTVDRTAHCTVPATSNATLVAACAGCTYQWSTTGLPNSSNASLSATYTTSGNKNISVTVTDANGCESKTTKNNIVKISNLKAILFKTGKGGCPPYTVTFADSTNAPEPITGVSWTFQGGSITSATGKNPPAVTYATPGVYPVTMQVQTASGCVAIVKDTIRVSNKPVGTFTATPTTVCYEAMPNVLKWNGSPFDTLLWDFKDGSKATTLIDSVSHFYQDLGDFRPCVIASKDGCRSDSICMNQITIKGPIANFKDSFTCDNRKQYYYVNLSREATSSVWTFCDGTSSTQFNTQKLYANCDTCTVKLTVSSSVTGCTHSKSVQTKVICQDADFTVSDTVGCKNFRPTFTNKSSSTTSTYWDFNTNNGLQFNKLTATVTTPNNTYNTPGYYGVSMINTDAKGCRDTITKQALIKITSVTASMAASDTVFCIPQTVGFTNNSTAAFSSISQSVWNYGDGSPADSVLNTAHQYAVQGVYRPLLTVKNEYGCTDTISKRILANRITAIAVFDDSTCVGTSNLFSNQSTGINQVYQWHFPGGIPSYSNGRNVNVVYNSEGDYPVMLIVNDNTGTCRDTLRDTIHVYDPIADYRLSQKYAQCPNPPFFVQFFDSSRNDIETWEWDFGDGTPISNLRNPSHYYHRAGVFPVRLTVKTNNGCESTLVKDTVRVDGPFASMTFSPLPGICPCDSVEFTINTVSAVQAILLDGQNSPYTFPPLTPGTFDNPTVLKRKVQFCTSGTANAQVLISDGVGCNVLLQPVPVLVDTPSTHFSFVNNVCDSGSVCFTDNTMFYTPGTEFASRLWNFGDGTTDTTANPCHIFTKPGDYNVTLTVHNNLGCSMSETKKVHIHASPKVMVAANDSTGCVPQTIQFSHHTVVDSTTSIASLNWNFGNGNTSVLSNPSQAFTQAGLYNVQLTVTDSFGCSASGSLPITINSLPNVKGIGDTTICVGGVAQLSGLGGVSCVWTPALGLSNAQSCAPTASPANDQQYILTATDANGCQGTDTVTVKVAKLNAAFTTNTVCYPAATQFTFSGSNTNGTIASYLYDLGDGTNATTANHNHNYSAANSYSVRLIITDIHGCQDDTFQNVVVRETPVALATADTVCAGLATTLRDASTYGAASASSRVWNLGVGTQSANDSVVAFTYPAAGNYTATLKVTNDAGCSNSTSVNVFVRANPIADYTATEVCQGSTTNFTANAKNGTGIVNTMAWDFNTANAGVNTSSATTGVQFTYAAAGTYQASLRVTDNFGCKHDTVKPIIVFALPQALYSVANNCTNADVQFTSNSVAGTNSIATHNWTFGIGTPSTSNNTNPKVTVGNAPGVYAVRLIVADAKGCADTLNSTFKIQEGPHAKFFVYDSTVCLNNCVQLTSTSTAGESNISSYAWDMNSNGTIDYTSNKVSCHKYSTAGNKVVKLTVTDENGCVDTDVRNIQIISIPTADFQWQPVCKSSPMALTNNSTAGSAALSSCLWIFHDGSFNNNCNTNKVFHTPGDYPVTFVSIDAYGCSDTISKVVHVDAPTQLVNIGDTTICKGEMLTYNAEGVFSQIKWTPDTYINNSESANVVIYPSTSIKYIVEAKNGACKSISDTMQIDVIQPIPLEVSAAPDKVLLGVNTNVTAEVGGVIDSIVWSPSAGLDCNNCLNPKATPEATTTYYATIYYSMNGVTCTQTDSTTITVFESCGDSPIFVPNTFTPNGDGLNDGFTIRGAGISKIKNFRIFDRWGKMVFSTENAAINSGAAMWFGTDMSGKELNPGVFVYMYEIVCLNNEVLSGKGNITLIK